MPWRVTNSVPRSLRFTSFCVCAAASSSLPSRRLPVVTTVTSRSAASATYVQSPPNHPDPLRERKSLKSCALTGSSSSACYQLPEEKVRPHQPAPSEEEAQVVVGRRRSGSADIGGTLYVIKRSTSVTNDSISCARQPS